MAGDLGGAGVRNAPGAALLFTLRPETPRMQNVNVVPDPCSIYSLGEQEQPGSSAGQTSATCTLSACPAATPDGAALRVVLAPAGEAEACIPAAELLKESLRSYGMRCSVGNAPSQPADATEKGNIDGSTLATSAIHLYLVSRDQLTETLRPHVPAEHLEQAGEG